VIDQEARSETYKLLIVSCVLCSRRACAAQSCVLKHAFSVLLFRICVPVTISVSLDMEDSYYIRDKVVTGQIL